MASLIDRMVRAARLDASLYEEVEADQNTMGQATTVVLLSASAGGLALMVQMGSVIGLIGGIIGQLIGWYVWAFLTYFIGTEFLPTPETEANLGQLLRTTGFSAAPGIIRVIGVVPWLFTISNFVGNIWWLFAMVVAVRQALDYTSTWRALAVCSIGWVVNMLILFVISGATGGAAHTVTASYFGIGAGQAM